MNLDFISGLGVDERIFGKLKLPDQFTIHHIYWLPVSENESIENYCMRLSDQINRTSPFTLVGVSFGGIIAIELSKKLAPVQTVIISSFCNQEEVPKFYLLLGRLKLYKMLPVQFLLKPNNMIFRLFGANKQVEKELLKNIMLETDPGFFQWAVDQLFSWDNSQKPERFLHINGKSDKLLPLKRIMHAIPVRGGEHLMVYSKAKIVSQLLRDNLLGP